MNQVFSFSRWLLLVNKYWIDNRKNLLLSILAMAGLLLIWYLTYMVVNYYEPMQEWSQTVTYFIGLFVVGCLYGSLLFADLGSKPKGINFLLLPASGFEKLLCSLFYGVVICFVGYTLVFYLVDITMVNISNGISNNLWQQRPGQVHAYVPRAIINVFHGPRDRPFAAGPTQILYFLLIYFAVQAAFILGSVASPRYSFLKTAISLLLVALFFAFLISKVFFLIMPPGVTYNGITAYRLFGEGDKVVRLPEWVDTVVFTLFRYGLPPLFWITAYFRLKEKQL